MVASLLHQLRDCARAGGGANFVADDVMRSVSIFQESLFREIPVHCLLAMFTILDAAV